MGLPEILQMMLAKSPPASLRLSVDQSALASNWRALDHMSGTALAGAAVKADCYGLGVEACVPALRDAGANEFFVAHWSEVSDVARHVPPAQIAVLHGPLIDADVAYACATGAVPVINSLEQAIRWAGGGGGRCHVMVDSGINRLGLNPADLADPAIARLDIDILMSHLACADEDSAMNARQLARFQQITPQVNHRRLSLANSAGVALGSKYAFDLTRPGLSLYGGIPRPELAEVIRQVATPQAALIQTRQISAGDSVGYNATFTATHAMRIGVVSLGYADGILRAWSGAHFKYGECELPILGRVSMDMIVIDLSAAPDLREGDWVELPYFLPTAAQQTTLSQYELLTLLGTRLK